MAPTHGRFIWTDLQTSDVEGAIEFYGDVFGWEVEDVSSEGNPYWQFRKDGQLVAGIGPISDEAAEDGLRPNWTSYVAVDDAGEVCDRAADLGGEVVMGATEVGDAGSYAIVEDPTGGVLGLWQAGTHEGAERFNEPGSLSWNELVTRDVAAAKEFYSQLLPWELEDQDFGGFPYTTIVLDDDPNGGIFEMGESFPSSAPTHWSVYFAVADTDDAIEAARDGGGEVRGEVRDTTFGRVATLVDPQGASFRVITLDPEATGTTGTA